MGEAQKRPVSDAAFDVVGRYSQDRINGFSEEFLNRFVAHIGLRDGMRVLDLMAGDGNLSRRILNRAAEQHPPLKLDVTMLEYSAVQAEFARAELAALEVKVIHGDALSMQNLESGEVLPDNYFDRVIIKSSNHEIPLARQAALYRQVLRVLKPGGLFLNLGFMAETREEQRELREIARCKDTLAGMTAAAVNRHFLHREELEQLLNEAGFEAAEHLEHFHYEIASDIVASQYFGTEQEQSANAEFQASQARALSMRAAGLITFERDRSVMRCSGAITRAVKPVGGGSTRKVFDEYPYLFVKKIRAHRELLDAACRFLPGSGDVLDLGCGLGFLAERLDPGNYSYTGIDLSGSFVESCRARMPHRNFCFVEGDLNSSQLGSEQYDFAAALNTLYIREIKPIAVLRKAFDALRTGGRIAVSGPISQEAFRNAEPHIIRHLRDDGLLAGHEDTVEMICRANAQLLCSDAHYWSPEGMAELLRMAGFTHFLYHDNAFFYNNAFLVVAVKE